MGKDPSPIESEHAVHPFMIATYILAPLFALFLVIEMGGFAYIMNLRKELSRTAA